MDESPADVRRRAAQARRLGTHDRTAAAQLEEAFKKKLGQIAKAKPAEGDKPKG